MCQQYDFFVGIVKDKLRKVHKFTITTDIWTSSFTTQSYLGVTAHYLDNFEFESVVIGTILLHESPTADTICRALKACLESWEITINDNDKIAVFVTDNAANIVKAIQLYHGVENKRFKHLGCFHLIVFEDGIKEATGLNELLTKVKDIVSFFKRSVTASDKLKEKTPLKLIQSVPTRWNSTFFYFGMFF